jgi:hypothetical protein
VAKALARREWPDVLLREPLPRVDRSGAQATAHHRHGRFCANSCGHRLHSGAGSGVSAAGLQRRRAGGIVAVGSGLRARADDDVLCRRPALRLLSAPARGAAGGLSVP